MRNLEELYDTTQVMEDTTLFCFHADKDPPEKKKAMGVKTVYKRKEGIEGRSIHAWHDIPRLSLNGRFVELNSIQKVQVKEGNHPPPLAATSRSRQSPSHLKVEFSCSEFLYK